MVTVILNLTGPEEAAEYLIEDDPFDEEKLPFWIAHTYLAPDPALLTEATFPVDDAQTDDAAVMVAEGAVLIVADALPVDEHPALLVTTSEIPTVPEAPAV